MGRFPVQRRAGGRVVRTIGAWDLPVRPLFYRLYTQTYRGCWISYGEREGTNQARYFHITNKAYKCITKQPHEKPTLQILHCTSAYAYPNPCRAVGGAWRTRLLVKRRPDRFSYGRQQHSQDLIRGAGKWHLDPAGAVQSSLPPDCGSGTLLRFRLHPDAPWQKRPKPGRATCCLTACNWASVGSKRRGASRCCRILSRQPGRVAGGRLIPWGVQPSCLAAYAMAMQELLDRV